MGPLRPEFSVFIVDADFAAAESLVTVLKTAGYDTRYFPTFDSAYASIHEMPPHLMVFNLESFAEIAEEHLQKVRDVSGEILTVLLGSTKQAFMALQLVEKGLAYDYLIRPFISSLDLVQKLDRGAERLYFQFESEQLREAAGLVRAPGSSGEAPIALSTPDLATIGMDPSFESEQRQAQQGRELPPPPAPVSPPEPEKPSLVPEIFDDLLQKMASVKDLDQTVQTFLDALSAQLHNSPSIYFKYIPHYVSLVLSQSAWLPIEKIRGIGVELKSIDPLRLPEMFQDPTAIEPLRALMREAFRVDRFSAFPHFNDAEVLGVFVVFDPLNDEAAANLVSIYQRIFELAYKRNQVVKEKHSLEIHDSTTGLYNRKHFRLKLDDEISRSRRISMPLSLVTLDIDGFKELNQEIGFAGADTVLRMIGALLRKTTRANDIVSRIGPDEITLLLPHTDHMGAAVKAERVRRAIESTRFPVLEGRPQDHVSVSIGVSEYPAFCNDAEGLLKSADEALFQVKQAGGNRVCLATPPPGFTPDFVPAPSVDAGRGKR